MRLQHPFERHHKLHKEAQDNTLGYQWDDTRDKLPTSYHRQEITPLQNQGWPSIMTQAKIDMDWLTGRI